MDTTSGNNAHSTAQVHQQVEAMIAREDWGAVGKILHQYQGTTTGIVEKILKIIASGRLHFKPLFKCTRYGDQEAKALFFKLIEIKGRVLLFKKNGFVGFNSLHVAIKSILDYHEDSCSDEVVSKLLEVGGKGLVLETGGPDCDNVLQLRKCDGNHIQLNLLKKLIEVGGKELVLSRNKLSQNALHTLCFAKASMEEISYIAVQGGREVVLAQDRSGHNPLHIALMRFRNEDILEAILNLFTELGGAEILTQIDKNGRTPLHLFITDEGYSDNEDLDEELCEKLMSKGIKLQVGDEYAIGGLFSSNTNQEVQDRLYRRWKTVLLALNHLFQKPHGQNLPILQALVFHKAPQEVIKGTVDQLAGSVNTLDSSDQLPIDVAVQHNLSWNDGLKEIIEAFLLTEDSFKVLLVCAKNGLQWNNGMRTVVKGIDTNDIERKDEATCLYPFMLAGVGQDKDTYDLGTIFHLIKSSSSLVQICSGKNNDEKEEKSLGKRKRC